MNLDRRDMQEINLTGEQPVEGDQELAEKFAGVLQNRLKVRNSVHTAILTVFARVLQHRHLGEDDAIRFIKALVVPDDEDGIKKDNELMQLFLKKKDKDEPLFYKFFLDETYFLSHFKPDEKVEIARALNNNLLPVSRGDGAGVTLLHLALSKKYFELAFILVSELRANIEKKNGVGQAPWDVLRIDVSHPIYQCEASGYILRLMSTLPSDGVPKERILYVSKEAENKLRCVMKTLDNKVADVELDIFIGESALTHLNLDHLRGGILELLAKRGLIVTDLRKELYNLHEGISTPVEHCSRFSRNVLDAIDNTIAIWQRKQNNIWGWRSNKYLGKVQVSIDKLRDLKEKLMPVASFFTDRMFLKLVNRAVIGKLGTEVEESFSGYNKVEEPPIWVIGEFGENKKLLNRLSFLLEERKAIEPEGNLSKIKRWWKGTNECDRLSYNPFLGAMESCLNQTSSLCENSQHNDELIKTATEALAKSEREKRELQEENEKFREKNEKLQEENEEFRGENEKLRRNLKTFSTRYAELEEQAAVIEKKDPTPPPLGAMKTNPNEALLLREKRKETAVHSRNSFFSLVEGEEQQEGPDHEDKVLKLNKSH